MALALPLVPGPALRNRAGPDTLLSNQVTEHAHCSLSIFIFCLCLAFDLKSTALLSADEDNGGLIESLAACLLRVSN